jgi:hypothetical protein
MGTHRTGLRAVVAGAVTVAGASLALTGVVSVASAAVTPATLAVNAACYATASAKDRPAITITGSGYSPDGQVIITDQSASLDVTTTASPTGMVDATAPAPVPDLTKPGFKKDTITATEYSDSGVEYQGTTTTDITLVEASAAHTKRAPGLKALTFKTRWSFSGFPEGKTIYGHYLYGGKFAARQAFGKAQGPCGVLTVHKRLFPATPKHREYVLQIDARKKYSKNATPRLVSKVGVGLF